MTSQSCNGSALGRHAIETGTLRAATRRSSAFASCGSIAMRARSEPTSSTMLQSRSGGAPSIPIERRTTSWARLYRPCAASTSGRRSLALRSRPNARASSLASPSRGLSQNVERSHGRSGVGGLHAPEETVGDRPVPTGHEVADHQLSARVPEAIAERTLPIAISRIGIARPPREVEEYRRLLRHRVRIGSRGPAPRERGRPPCPQRGSCRSGIV